MQFTEGSKDVENILAFSGEKDSVYTLGQDSGSSKSHRSRDQPSQFNLKRR